MPHIAMCFSDSIFPYGPFVPHYVARQYIENYFSLHQTDSLLELNTTVEDLSWTPSSSHKNGGNWKLTLRKRDVARRQDLWWEEHFDAVILANGHYSVPYVSINLVTSAIFTSSDFIGPASARLRIVHENVSRSCFSLQILPIAGDIPQQAYYCSWKLCIWPRRRCRSRISR